MSVGEAKGHVDRVCHRMSLTVEDPRSSLREGDRGSEAVLYLLPQARRGRSYLVAEAISNCGHDIDSVGPGARRSRILP